jgi:hypothetical protein
MDESSEKSSLISRIKGRFMHKEKPQGIASQARPMSSEEYLQATVDMRPEDKDREVIRMQSEARQDIAKKRTRAMNTAAAVATMVTMGGVKTAVDNPPDLGEGVRGVNQAIVDTRERLATAKEPGTAMSDEKRQKWQDSANITMPDPSNPVPDTGIFPTEKPKQV